MATGKTRFDPLPHPPIGPTGGGDAKVLASPWGSALFQSVQVFKADGRKPLPRQLFDGIVDVVVAGDIRAPLASASGAATTDSRRDLPPILANRCPPLVAISLLVPTSMPTTSPLSRACGAGNADDPTRQGWRQQTSGQRA
jgi:hypothetical protein